MGLAPPSETAALHKAGLAFPALGPCPHHAGLLGGLVSRGQRKGFFAPALFQPQANETGRVQRDDDAAKFGAIAHDFFAAARHSFFKRRHGLPWRSRLIGRIANDDFRQCRVSMASSAGRSRSLMVLKPAKCSVRSTSISSQMPRVSL